MDFPKVAMVDGVFPANSKGHTYMPMPYHGSKAHGTRGGRKTKWAVPQNGQYYIFTYADERDWRDIHAEGLFSFCNGCEEKIGVNGEKLAFFKSPSNATDPWHGYPVFSSEIEDEELINRWYNEKEIKYGVWIKLLRHAL